MMDPGQREITEGIQQEREMLRFKASDEEELQKKLEIIESKELVIYSNSKYEIHREYAQLLSYKNLIRDKLETLELDNYEPKKSKIYSPRNSTEIYSK
jgi:hypothetical protein